MKLIKTMSALVCCTALAATTSRAASYSLSLLPTLGGTTASASGINDFGAVVGASALASGPTHATYWNAGLALDLGTLGNLSAVSGASAINNSGQISGYSQIGAGGTNSTSHAVLWPSPSEYPKTDLGTVDGLSAASSAAADINNAGQVVGYGGSADYFRAVHLWKTPVDLKVNRQGYSALGLNNNNQIVGDTGFVDSGSQMQSSPALWTLSNAGTFTETVLGLLPGATRGYAIDVNDAGLIIGTSITGSGAGTTFKAVRWAAAGTTAIALSTLGGTSSSVSGLNEAGLIVGASSLAGNTVNHAVLWDANGTVFDLNSLIDPVAADGWTLVTASDINESGTIVGTASKAGQTRAFVLSVSAVPEAATLALMLAGVVVVGTAARRQRPGTSGPALA